MAKVSSMTPFITRNDEIIDYSLRPAKSVERRMICEALSRLSILSSIKTYHYVGFGSTYFVDFTLFHKALGIQNLTSIEGNKDMEPRVRFNSPYSCINIEVGLSTDKLPEIDWESKRSILWLDYISALKGYMFNDIATFFTRALSGSIFIISINADIKDEANGKTISEKIKSKLNKDDDVNRRIRKSTLINNLTKDDYYAILRDVVIEEINSVLKTRNKLQVEDPFTFQQLFNFVYHDGQVMLTIGGILYSESDSAKVHDMAFNNFEFYRDGPTPFEISIPHLTNREIQALDKFLPSFHSDPKIRQEALDMFKNIVSESAIEKYAKVYQYFPIFKEIVL